MWVIITIYGAMILSLASAVLAVRWLAIVPPAMVETHSTVAPAFAIAAPGGIGGGR